MPTSESIRLLVSTSSVMRPVVSSSRRRSIATARLGISRNAAAPTSAEPTTNASRGNSTLHLDFDDVTDPEVTDDLHADRDHQQNLPHPLPEQQVHVFGVDEHQRH